MSNLTLLVDPDHWHPDNPAVRPHGVAANVWADRTFWVTITAERYYATADPTLTPTEHAERIIGEVTVVLFGEQARRDPACRASAWDAIVVATCDNASRLVIRLPDEGQCIIVCDSPDEARRFNDERRADYIARLRDPAWPNEAHRLYGRAA